MSTGIVICSVCSREVHQDGPREWHGKSDPNGTATWRHCEDKTPVCSGAAIAYPESTAQIVGRWCGCDEMAAGYGHGV